MVLTPRVPSKDAEQARFLANELRGIGRMRSQTGGRVTRRMHARQSRLLIEVALPRAIAIAENYLLVTATRLIKPVLLTTAPPPSPPDLDTVRLRNCAKSFPKLIHIWDSDFGVDLSALPSWSYFEESRDLRHVLVHRLGTWQPGIDSPHPRLAARLGRVAANPDAYRGEVPMAATELQHGIDTVLSIVSEADQSLP